MTDGKEKPETNSKRRRRPRTPPPAASKQGRRGNWEIAYHRRAMIEGIIALEWLASQPYERRATTKIRVSTLWQRYMPEVPEQFAAESIRRWLRDPHERRPPWVILEKKADV